MSQELPSFHVDRTPRENRDLFVSGWHASARGRYTAIVALTSLDESRGYEQLEFGNIYRFAYETAGLSRHDVNGMLPVGKALRSLRKTDAAFRGRSLCWSKVRLVARVATPETEDHWLALAMKRTSTALEHLVSRKAEPIVKDDYVPMPAIPVELQRKLYGLYGLVRKALGDLNLSDEECLNWVADAALEKLAGVEGGESSATAGTRGRDGGESSVAAGTGGGDGGESSVTAGTDGGDWARSTAEVAAKNTDHRRSRHIPAHIARAVHRRAGYRCEVPGCGNTVGLETDHLVLWSEGGTHDEENLRLICGSCHAARHRKRRGCGGGGDGDTSAA